MNLTTILSKAGFRPNTGQREAIAHLDGPLLIKAGPGSGKTQVLVMRTLHLMLGPRPVEPGAILLCTFTEKAAAQLRERISANLRQVEPAKDISDLMVGTIHGICHRLIDEFLSKTPLKRGYTILDEMTQRLFIYQHLKVISPPSFGPMMGNTQKAAKALKYFNKITEELIDPQRLLQSKDAFVRELGESYGRYVVLLRSENVVDFAFLQRYVYDLTDKPGVREKLASRFSHLMVDEYQDTNYIQEQLLLRFAASHHNLCVVGDDDQSLYRFRGATVRNLLEFPNHFNVQGQPGLSEVILGVNYRSQKTIVGFYSRFMSEQSWTGPGGRQFRFSKQITPHRTAVPAYPAVFKMQAGSEEAAAESVARLIKSLQTQNVIHDLNEVAILLTSVRRERSGDYMAALTKQGLPFYAPRARQFLENLEVKAAVGALVEVLNFYGKARGTYALEETWQYIDGAVKVLYDEAGKEEGALRQELADLRTFLFEVPAKKASGLSLLDIFYRLQRFQPFSRYIEAEATARNLAIFSRLLTQFQQYYKSPVLFGDSLERVRTVLFGSFIHMLVKEGLDEYEDPYDIFPAGHVQIMTIHQSKGLEFPVVIVGSLDARARSDQEIDRALGAYYVRPEFEPADRIGEFDFLRRYYVAFSRAEHMLVLPAGNAPNPRIRKVWRELPDAADLDWTLFRRLTYEHKEAERPKPSYSLTSDVLVYDTCPRQYQLLKQYEFQAAAGGQMFFGTLVHHTIEDCHRHILEEGLGSLKGEVVEGYFEANYQSLRKQGIHPIAQEHKEAALGHVTNYLKNSPDILNRVRQTEVPIVVDKQSYYLTGIIDVLLGEDGKWELLDFKANQRIDDADNLRLQNYKLQLATYGRAIEEKLGIRPERFSIYWTGEREKKKAYMPLAISRSDMEAAHDHFDAVARSIMAGNFALTPPRKHKLDRKVCQECDFRWGCSHRKCELPARIWAAD